MTDFSRRLYEWRNRSGLDQAQVAEALGVSRVSYNRWETGKAYPRRNWFRLQRAMEWEPLLRCLNSAQRLAAFRRHLQKSNG